MEKKGKSNPVELFHEALLLRHVRSRVRSRRVGRATYQVPVVRRVAAARRSPSVGLSRRRGRNENTMVERLSGELLDAANNRGTAVKKREDTHRAEANCAFSHYQR